jgi:hypothetical protein
VPAARRAFAAAACLLIAIAFLWLRPVATPGPPLRDFEAYYAAGATWRAAGDPYSRDVWRVERHLPGVVASRDELLPYVGPPYALPLWGLLGGLGFGAAVVVWGIVLVAAAALLGICTARLADLRDPTSIAALVLLGAAFGPLTSALALGQVALVSCAGVVATALALAQARTRLVVAIGTAWLAALQPNLALALVARLTDRRAWLALGLAALLALATTVAILGGFDGLRQYGALLQAHVAAERTVAIQLTVAAVAFGFGASEAQARIVATLVALGVITATALLLRSHNYAPHARVAVASAALPLILPFSHEHDLTIALFPAVLCLRRARRAWWIAAACATVAVAVDWLGLAQRPSGVPQSVTLALAVACAAIALSRGRIGPAAAAPIALAAGVTLVGTWAAHHPLGVWPYALGPSFRAPLALDTSAVWHLEQMQSGLAAPSVPSALLRTLSLAGCAALWCTALAILRRPDPEASRS